jgi:hypothetical protein
MVDRFGVLDYIKPYLAKDKTFAEISRRDIMPFLKRIRVLPKKYYRFSKSSVKRSGITGRGKKV